MVLQMLSNGVTNDSALNYSSSDVGLGLETGRQRDERQSAVLFPAPVGKQPGPPAKPFPAVAQSLPGRASARHYLAADQRRQRQRCGQRQSGPHRSLVRHPAAWHARKRKSPRHNPQAPARHAGAACAGYGGTRRITVPVRRN